MFDYAYLVEILTPKRADPAQVEKHLEGFAGRYRKILDAGCGLSVPDNPMGQPRLGALEAIKACGLPLVAAKTVMNLNTFHTKQELDQLLAAAIEAGLKYVLVVRGDGGPALSKLDPQAIGGAKSVATSTDLLRYVNSAHAGQFITGAAYNHFAPPAFERDKLQQKIEAGARFVVTQPVIGQDPNVDYLFGLDIPVVVEAWMSTNIDLLFKSVRKGKDQSAAAYDPVQNLKALHQAYPQSCIYLSMLSFKQDWQSILPRL